MAKLMPIAVFKLKLLGDEQMGCLNSSEKVVVLLAGGQTRKKGLRSRISSAEQVVIV